MYLSTLSLPPNPDGQVNKFKTDSGSSRKINRAIIRKVIMRIQLVALLLFAVCFHISAAVFSQSITLSEKKAPLETVLNKVGRQSGYDVFSQSELLAGSNTVNVDIKNMPLDKALEQIFKGQPFTYAIVGHTIVIKKAAVTIVRGVVLDADTKEPLTGATVTLKGTTHSASAGVDGSFRINVADTENPVLVISFISYVTKEVPVDGKTDLGEIDLKSSQTAMSEVVVNGDVAIDRKTPVAVSTIGPTFIQEHIGAQDIPELLSTIPGVMVTAQGGGYGDSRISIRGFSSRSGNGNVAFTINGIPINDPETGTLYWSDFSGITDVASSIQVQRGLGASKIITPSFGGTVNITTRSVDMQEGGFVQETIGSDGFDKTTLLISTGLTPSGWAATFQGSRVQGNGFADGLNFLGYNYFFNLAKQLTPNQTLSFNLIGATQTHGQRAEEPLADYQEAPQGNRWNYYLSVENGQQTNPYNNFFSEPLFSINHDWSISENSSLATVLYAMFGSGGGGGIDGLNPPRIGNTFTPFNLDAVEASNAASPDGSAATWLYASYDKTQWYGLRSTYHTLLGKYINLSAGVDLRYYFGNHYQAVTDLLGADYVLSTYGGNPAFGTASGDINNPIERAGVGDKIDYYNRDFVESGGVFAQAEYSKKDLTAFVTLSGSDNADKREDFFNYLNSDPAQTSPWVSFLSYQAKAGANYNISEGLNAFANVGYLTKPPYYASVFENFTNQLNKAAIDEKLLSYELGVNYRTSEFSAKLNLYRSIYLDRAFSSTYQDQTSNPPALYSVNLQGVDELHQGVELELTYRPIKEITIGGMLSVGDYYYTKNAGPASVFDNNQKLVATLPVVLLKGLKVGDVAQTTAAITFDAKVLPQLSVGAIYNFYGNYTADYVFSNLTQSTLTKYNLTSFHPYIVPNYSLWSVNAIFKFKMAGFNSELIGTVNNLLNTKYISDAFDANAVGNPAAITGYYGLGRVFTTGLRVRF